MARTRVEGVPVGDLDDLAEIHDRDPLGEVPDHGQVVRDEQERDAHVALELLEQVDDLRLDRHVQRRDRLVGDDQLGVEGERAGHPDALPLAAGELVREAVVVLGVEPDDLQQLLDPVLHAARRVDAVDLHRAADDAAHRVPGVERRVRVLEDHLNLGPDRLEPPAAGVADLPPGVPDVARGRLQQPGGQPPGGGLAAARLADQPEGLPGVHRQVDAVHRVDLTDLTLEDEAARQGEVLLQPGQLQQRLAAGFTGCLAHLWISRFWARVR
jgi:hypothetical protein